jgi:hypothetical protein
MATATAKLGLNLPADGEPGWGAMLRANFTALDQSAAGQNCVKVLTGGTYVLSATEGRCDSFEVSGALTSNLVIIVPNNMPTFAFENLTTGNFTVTVKTALGAGVVVDQLTISMMYCNGTNCEFISGVQARAAVVSAGGTVTLKNSDISGNAIEISGALTSNLIVVVPKNAAPFAVENLTTGAFTVTVKTALGTGFVLPYGISVLYCNGTNCECVSSGVEAQIISTATTVIAATQTKVALGGDAFTSGGITTDNVNSRLTCVNPGTYLLRAKVGGLTTAAIQNLTVSIFKNGVQMTAAVMPSAAVTNPVAVAAYIQANIDGILNMVAGDYVELFAICSVASGVTCQIGQCSLSLSSH